MTTTMSVCLGYHPNVNPPSRPCRAIVCVSGEPVDGNQADSHYMNVELTAADHMDLP